MELLPIYGINDFSSARLSSFYSNKLSKHLDSHHFINSPHKHSTYIVVLFTKGTGEHHIDFQSYNVAPGAVFLLNPGQVHCWKLSSDAEGYVFFHSGDFYDSIFVDRKLQDFPFYYLQQNHPVVYLEKPSLDRLERLLREINEEYIAKSSYRKARLGSLVDLAYIEIARQYFSLEQAPQTSSSYIRVRQFLKLIDINYKSKKSASHYADLMNMSVRHLSRICKETVNRATSDLITERILMEAKRLLINQDVSVAMVAYELGYEDSSYFTRLFKKHIGVRPKDFQNKSRFFNAP